MQVSLNHLVHMLADQVGQPFSVPVQEQLKVVLNYKRADYFRKLIENNPWRRKYYLKDISAELEQVDRAECPVEVDCNVLRTVEQIPPPISTSYTLFDYVGDPDKLDGYTYVTPEQLVFMIQYGSRYTKDRPKYFYINGYVYVYNEQDLEYINIRAIWPDVSLLAPFNCPGSELPCYTDDMTWDIPDDIINAIIKDVINNELKLYLTPEEDTEVKVDDKSK